MQIHVEMPSFPPTVNNYFLYRVLKIILEQSSIHNFGLLKNTNILPKRQTETTVRSQQRISEQQRKQYNFTV